MDEITFNLGGSYATALFFCGLSAVVMLIVYVGRMRGSGEKLWAFSRRNAYLPILVPLFAYYGVLYWWVFHDQFFILQPRSSTWRLEYRVPTRSVVVALDSITDIRLETGTARVGQMARVIIETADGTHYPSAQFARRRGKGYVEKLEQLRAGAAE